MDKSFNVREWRLEQVINWISGLDQCFEQYKPIFVEEQINGEKLLSLTSDVLFSFNITIVGHQIILLDSIEFLRTLQHNIEHETLQSIVLRVSRHASAVHECVVSIDPLQKANEDEEADDTRHYFISREGDRKRLNSELCSCTLQLMEATKQVVAWLDRSPFSAISECEQLRKDIVVNAFEINTNVQVYLARAQASQPVKPNMKAALQSQSAKLRDICIKFVRTSREPLVFTPCLVENVHIMKTEKEDLGLRFRSSDNFDYHVVHSVQPRSPADQTTRVDEGDEIVQVNDKTVIGWQHFKVVEEIRRYPTRVVLMLRKRPSHVNDYRRPHKYNYPRPVHHPRPQYLMPRQRPSALSSTDVSHVAMGRQMSVQGSDDVFTKPESNAGSGTESNDVEGGQYKAVTAPPSVSGERRDVMGSTTDEFITAMDDEEGGSVSVAPGGRGPLSSDSVAIMSSPKSDYLSRVNQGEVVVQLRHRKPPRKSARRISCKDLGQGDCQGWLWRKRSTTITALWVKRWCVIKNNSLYYYRCIDDQHAEGLINLRGFVISPLLEVKGRYAFRVYNDYNTITFASESEQDRSKWMNKLGLAAIGYDTSRLQQMGGFGPAYTEVAAPTNPGVDFSESDEEDDDRGDGGSVSSTNSDGVVRRHPSSASSASQAVQMARRVSNFYTLSTIDEEEKRHSNVMRTLREAKRLERMILDKKQQVEVIEEFLQDANLNGEQIRNFLQEYSYIFSDP